MEITVLGNVDYFSIAALCCYGDMPHSEQKKFLKRKTEKKVKKDRP